MIFYRYFCHSTELSAKDLELRHVQEDHDRLMERHSALLSQLASKERQSREKQEQLVKLASQAEKARQDAIASLQQQTEALKQTYRVRNASHFLIRQLEIKAGLYCENHVFCLIRVDGLFGTTTEHPYYLLFMDAILLKNIVVV